MDYKLKNTVSKDAFRYGYLSKKIAPFLKPHVPRILLNMLLAIPLGLLDGVVAYALKPYMDCVINGQAWKIFGFTIEQSVLATAIPFAIVSFAIIQGLLRYSNNYLTDWTGNKISNSLKIELFKKLTSLDPVFTNIPRLIVFILSILSISTGIPLLSFLISILINPLHSLLLIFSLIQQINSNC